MPARAVDIVTEPAALLRRLHARIAHEGQAERDRQRQARLASFRRRIVARMSELGAC